MAQTIPGMVRAGDVRRYTFDFGTTTPTYPEYLRSSFEVENAIAVDPRENRGGSWSRKESAPGLCEIQTFSHLDRRSDTSTHNRFKKAAKGFEVPRGVVRLSKVLPSGLGRPVAATVL